MNILVVAQTCCNHEGFSKNASLCVIMGLISHYCRSSVRLANLIEWARYLLNKVFCLCQKTPVKSTKGKAKVLWIVFIWSYELPQAHCRLPTLASVSDTMVWHPVCSCGCSACISRYVSIIKHRHLSSSAGVVHFLGFAQKLSTFDNKVHPQYVVLFV